MRKFTHVTATSLAEVIPLLDHSTRPLAGGTDLVTQLKDHLISPDRLVSLRGLGLRGVAVRAGRLYIGALTTLSELERDPQLRSDPYRRWLRLRTRPPLRSCATPRPSAATCCKTYAARTTADHSPAGSRAGRTATPAMASITSTRCSSSRRASRLIRATR